MGNAGCPRCGSAVALHDGRPFVAATGAVSLWHRTCWEARDLPVAAEPVLPPPIRYSRAQTVVPNRARLVGAASVVAALGVAFAGWATAGTTGATLVNIDVGEPEALAIRTTAGAHEIVPPRVNHQDGFAIPTVDGVPLDKLYPSLRGWIHPVSASNEKVPELKSRRFGSERLGIERSECGAGHCGVDLDGPRGRPIVAVAAGTVVRVEQKELGADGRSGRYVRIEHDDGTLTAYMHLDEVAHGLRVGDRVDAAQYVGTLGATAVYSAQPHLHFSLEIPDRAGIRGDHSETEYVDPAPFLSRARIAPAPARAPKPAF
ncbi:MAG: M23 family metallopeptidase [Deltaproteobacteria bacterium]|nr:M23 family metallopeptidase [Deltaproteobacteria bacterium]